MQDKINSLTSPVEAQVDVVLRQQHHKVADDCSVVHESVSPCHLFVSAKAVLAEIAAFDGTLASLGDRARESEQNGHFAAHKYAERLGTERFLRLLLWNGGQFFED